MPLKLAAAEYGQGPPVLVLHGLFGSGRNWASIAQKLAPTYRVFTLDLRNHGASPWAETMGYAEMADDVRAFIAERGLGRVAVIGHSMGGKTAMVLALRHGDLVERLVVVDVAPAANPPTLLAYVRAMQDVDLSRVTRRADADAPLAAAVPDPAVRAFLLQNLLIDGGHASWRLNLAAIDRAMGGLTGFPELPPGSACAGATLFVAGARSDYVRPEHEPTIMRLFPQARIEHIAEAGHWVHAEQPGAFLGRVAPFLADLTAPPAATA